MLPPLINKLRKKPETKKNLQVTRQSLYWKSCSKSVVWAIAKALRVRYETVRKNLNNYKNSNEKHELQKRQFHLLIDDVKSNINVSYDTFNKLRKKSKTKQSLRTPCQRLYYSSCCRSVGWAIWYLTSPSLQISFGGSTNWSPYPYDSANSTYNHQNSQRYRHKDSDLRTHQQSNHWRAYQLLNISLSCQRKLSWLTALNKIARFVWSPFLIVTWKQKLSRPITFLFPTKGVL